MTDFNLHVTVKIEAPELCAALTLLANARPVISPGAKTGLPAVLNVVPTLSSAATPVKPAPAVAPVAPRVITPAQTPMPDVPAPQLAAPASVPTAPTRQYSFPDIQRAATSLCDAGKRDGVMALLSQYQIKALSELPQEQYGAFATALRGLGAKI